MPLGSQVKGDQGQGLDHDQGTEHRGEHPGGGLGAGDDVVGLDGRSAKTIEKNEHVLAPILATIGASRLASSPSCARAETLAARLR